MKRSCKKFACISFCTNPDKKENPFFACWYVPTMLNCENSSVGRSHILLELCQILLLVHCHNFPEFSRVLRCWTCTYCFFDHSNNAFYCKDNISQYLNCSLETWFSTVIVLQQVLAKSCLLRSWWTLPCNLANLGDSTRLFRKKNVF